MSLPAEAELIQAALAASEHAYIPYSNYRVGAALLTTDGEVYSGCNVESASYTPTICAERTALVKAISEGKREFSAVAVVTRDGGSPCGVCRQLLFEFSPRDDGHHGRSAGQCASASDAVGIAASWFWSGESGRISIVPACPGADQWPRSPIMPIAAIPPTSSCP